LRRARLTRRLRATDHCEEKMNTKKLLAATVAAALCGAASAERHEVPAVPELDHVFVIMMENHGYGQVVGNPNEPYLNGLIASGKVSYATNYYGVGHPSLTNYLEVVGGSNFGVRSDKYPNWHNGTCAANLVTGHPVVDNGGGAALAYANDALVCPIAGPGTDAETPAMDSYNEVSCGGSPVVCNVLADIDGVKAYGAVQNTVQAQTIAHQLANAGRTWKTYQESLPLRGADLVNYSNGTASHAFNLGTGKSAIDLSLGAATNGGVVAAYAVKHNPFAYFADIQAGSNPALSLAQTVGFDQLFTDLASGNVPAYSFIAPNQCNDQHGRGNGDAFCAYDPAPDGSQNGLNAALIAQGDVMLERLVTAIKASPSWGEGHNAIVILWDENDYSGVVPANPNTVPAPLVQNSAVNFPAINQNRVLLTVETSYRHSPNVGSANYYNHFSLLRTIEAGLGLPCLNHACDHDTAVMSDLFSR
jgi:hypothetical protein